MSTPEIRIQYDTYKYLRGFLNTKNIMKKSLH